MSDNKKNNFFSWLTSKIKKKIIDATKDNLEVDKNDNEKKIYVLENELSTKNNTKENKIETLKDSINHIENKKDEKKNFFSRLRQSLKKTKTLLGDGINNIFLSKKIDDALFEELEEKMLLADIGINTTNRIITHLIKDIDRKYLKDSKQLYYSLKKNMYTILKEVEVPLKILTHHKPFIILVIGVNGVGKTTTVAKLAQKYKLEGKSVMLVAADTFRAAGIEQLQILGKINRIPVISRDSGSDPAAVVFDAIQSAQSKKVDILIIDTAGRLHNKLYLIDELKKIIRVIKKIDVSAPHEIMLIIDASNGQNTIQQTDIFHKEFNLTGMIMTKLDGTAKGGVIFSLADQFKIPIRYIGIGEKTEDLGAFNSKEFIESIFMQ